MGGGTATVNLTSHRLNGLGETVSGDTRLSLKTIPSIESEWTMAIVSDGAKTLIYTFEDRDKNTARLTMYAPGLAVTEDVITWATTTGYDLLAALTNAAITDVSVIQRYVNDAVVQPPEESDVERKGLFSFEVDGGGVSSFRVPSFLNTKVIDGTNTINTTDPAVAAFIAAMEDSGLFDLYGMGNFRGDKLVDLATAPKKVHKNSTKG